MPDLRGMYAEAAGFNALGVGGVHGDVIRNAIGTLNGLGDSYAVMTGTGAITVAVTSGKGNALASGSGRSMTINLSRVVPTGPVNAPRRWGALACCYLGKQAS